MLKKLFKYDFENAAKIFIILYGIIALLSVLGKLLFTLVPEGLENVPLLSVLIPTYVLLVIGLIFGFEIFLIVRFYRSLFTDEGYLYHTLPVKPWQLIVSKLLTNVILSFCGIVILVLCGLILLAGAPMAAIVEHWEEVRELLQLCFGTSPLKFLVFLVIALPISECSTYLTYFASIALGQILIPKHKVLGAFASYIIYHVIIQIITSVPLFTYTFSTANQLIEDTSVTYSTEAAFESGFSWMSGFYSFTYFLSLAICVVSSFAFFFITNLIMKKKLNLD